MKRTWTIIRGNQRVGQLEVVPGSVCQPTTLPARDHFGQILDSDGTVLLCLHEWGTPPSASETALVFIVAW